MSPKESNFVSAVICLHKGDTNIKRFLEMINDVLSSNFKKYEIVCVNNDADSRVIDEVKKYKRCCENTIISIINMGFEHGLEACMNAGIDLAIGDFVFEFDSSYIDYDKELIMQVYYNALEGYDIVSAVPPKDKNKITSKIFYYIYNRFSESNNKLMTERFRIISRRAINRVSAYSKTIPYRKAIYASSGLKLSYINYQSSTSAINQEEWYSESEKSNTAMDSLILFTNLAYKVSLSISVIMAIFMVASGLYTVIAYLGINKPVAGWAPIMGLVSLGFFAIFIVLTIIIKYLDVLLRIVFRKQKYLISSIEKL